MDAPRLAIITAIAIILFILGFIGYRRRDLTM